MNHKFIETWSDFILNETLKTHDIDLTLFKSGPLLKSKLGNKTK